MKRYFWIIIIIIIVVAYYFLGFNSEKNDIVVNKNNSVNTIDDNITKHILSAPVYDENKKYLVSRVFDGDTIELSNGDKVRLIGIDAPEMNWKKGSADCYAQEAFEFTKKLLLGKSVSLEKDISETDKYDRLLRYVYLNGIHINKYLLEQGYAKTLLISPDYKYSIELKVAETNAQKQNKGLWKACFY